MNSVTVNLLGGLEHLFDGTSTITVPITEYENLKELIQGLTKSYIKKDPELFSEDGYLSPGILALIDSCDIFTLDGEETQLNGGETITFISTIHGG